MRCLHDACLHVEHARTSQYTGIIGERSLCERADLVHRVVVSEEQNRRTRRRPHDHVRTHGRIDEFCHQTRFALDQFRNTTRAVRHAFGITRRRLHGDQSTDVRHCGVERFGRRDEERMHGERIG